MPDPLRRRVLPGMCHFRWTSTGCEQRRPVPEWASTTSGASAASIPGLRLLCGQICALDIVKSGDVIALRISGNGFLYNMVRIIAGTLAEAGRGFRAPDSVKKIFEAEEREKSGATAPPQGLVLDSIRYGEAP